MSFILSMSNVEMSYFPLINLFPNIAGNSATAAVQALGIILAVQIILRRQTLLINLIKTLTH